MKVTVLGSGSWGTALACKSVQAGNTTYLYCRQAPVAKEILRKKENITYLPGVILPEELKITSDLKEALFEAQIILVVTPSIYVRDILEAIEPVLQASSIIVICSKGIERQSGKRLSEVAREVVGHKTKHIAILSGPNHAEEIARDLPAATVIAANDMESAKLVQDAMNSHNFRVYVNEDMTGVELAGTTKNIIALAAGIVDGMGLGDNCKSLLLTRGLHEMAKFGLALGARRETYSGLAGMGDLIATCMSKHSRNRSAGQKLAAGETMDYIVNHSKMVVEGFFAVKTVYEIGKEKGLDLPITEALYEVLYFDKKPSTALIELMGRHVKDEMNL
ncbi:NAD(P)H-dependent glycerol-3-phosphate dehydrogenase [uncultured Veillonella sp.]|uniref:NAD(P)H-dependent glycerol-3-phosphate dehydrogenase n=1 Tax=uncultured Veillonella sp. TaxID=159268 RepID=UPI0025EF0219|nr:NAD(P)H-dependent glycerol-3-phosphate dehydrogenase [uncultured Veillonella sp.]MDY3973784.1 NAD(P)H-dependent glycerol-3-phosphate dehydrogenase [Veillonella caviae]